MDAPQVVAKGVGYLALKIKELAQKHDIPLVENKPLAQALYKSVEVGEHIPTNLYKAVAEILAYIYKARNAWNH
jgi:flagellar biosynthetic protein FlhB